MRISNYLKIFLFNIFLIICSSNSFALFKYYINQVKLYSNFKTGLGHNLRFSSGEGTLDFDGEDDFIDFGDESSFEFTSSFTIEAWVLQEETVSSGTILSKSNVKSGDEIGFKLTLNNNVPIVKWYDSSSTLIVNLVSPYSINNNKWYHIASTYDGATVKMYIDGIEVASDGPASNISYSTENFIIGATYNSDIPTTPKDFFNGFIDEVRLWDVALTANQIHEMMNQEIQQNGTAVRGKIIPQNISEGLLWTNLLGYYDMNDNDATNKSGHERNGEPRNMTTLQEQTAPLPYTTKANGDWFDTSATTPWAYGDSVWSTPNSVGIDGVTPIDWNIVVTDHNVNIETFSLLGREIKVLGLIVNSNKLTAIGDNVSHTGNGLAVTGYLKLDGEIDLDGESQLIQTSGSILDVTSSGNIEKDQQGTRDLYTYNHWSSPVGENNIVSNNNKFTVPNVIKDGTNATLPATVTFLTSGYNGTSGPPISIADYWIWKYAIQPNSDYSAWQHLRSTGSIATGEGFTMKGITNTNGNITLEQNYVFNGKPNNGDITLALPPNSDYLVGNPYPSALDADEFIKDNISSLETNGRNVNGNIINGALYFWDHFAKGTHVVGEYQGGYASYTLMGGSAAINNDVRINATSGVATKIPERYIPVGQGFFVSSVSDSGLTGLSQPVVGGDILFKNSQRIFKIEDAIGFNTGSVFFGVNQGLSKEKTSGEKTSETPVDPRQKIRLMYDSPSGYHRQLLVGVDESASNNFDLGYDALLNDNNKEDMYWSFNNNKFVIQAVNNFDNEQALAFGVKTSKEGLSRIKIEDLQNIDNNLQIFVHDKDADIYHDLRASDFEFQLPAGTYMDKFELVFSLPQGESLGDAENEFKALQVYYSNESESIVLANPNLIEIKNIELLNILGQSIVTIKDFEEQEFWEYKVKNLSSGTYVLKMNTVSGSVSKKVLVK